MCGRNNGLYIDIFTRVYFTVLISEPLSRFTQSGNYSIAFRSTSLAEISSIHTHPSGITDMTPTQSMEQPANQMDQAGPSRLPFDPDAPLFVAQATVASGTSLTLLLAMCRIVSDEQPYWEQLPELLWEWSNPSTHSRLAWEWASTAV